MKRIITIAIAFMFVANLAAQSTKGGIYFEGYLTSKPLETNGEYYWATSPVNSQVRDYYMPSDSYKIFKVRDASGNDITSKCQFSRSYGSGNTEKVPAATVNMGTPLILTAKYGSAECSVRIFKWDINEKVTIAKINDTTYTILPERPVKRAGVNVSISDYTLRKGMHITPKFELAFRDGRYYVRDKNNARVAKFKGTITTKGSNPASLAIEGKDELRPTDLKPGDFVYLELIRRQYKAIDGGLRENGKMVAPRITAEGAKNVKGIVVAVYDEVPFKNKGCKGVYTSDGKLHHALVVDVNECDRKWVFCSEKGNPAGAYSGNGCEITKGLISWNETQKNAGLRVKPIYWIVSCKEIQEKFLLPGTSGWFLPLGSELAGTDFSPVNTSLQKLIDAGRKDAQLIHEGSDYWTSNLTKYDKAEAWNYDRTNNVVNYYDRKLTAELFVRAFLVL